MLAIAVLIAAAGCDEAFDPKGTFENRLVIFGLLTPDSDSVQIRLQATYDPTESDPLSTTEGRDLSGATATIQWSTGQTTLHDTLVPYPGRYTTGLHLLTAPLRVARGTAYTVQVDRPGYGRVEARTRVPASAPIYFRDEVLLHDPAASNDLVVLIGLAPEAYGYLPRLWLEYEIPSQGNRVERREVPSDLIVTTSQVAPEYPLLQGAPSDRSAGSTSFGLYRYRSNAYRYILQRLYETYGQSDLRFRRAILTVATVDQHFYTYYFLVNGFFDPYTVRTDEPDYSNVDGGVGFVGSYAVDSLVVTLPAVF
jgi:hypothetical protein